MEKNIFKLDNEQLKGIAHAFREKVEEGLNKNNAEIQCIPTFILPKATDVKGKALVLDLGGTNYRVAIVDFSTEKPIIYPNNGWKKDMSIMKSPGYTREELFKELADLIVEIKREEEMPIGYCFLIRPNRYREAMQDCFVGPRGRHSGNGGTVCWETLTRLPE